MLTSSYRYFLNIFINFLPPSRLFALKRFLINSAGHRIHLNAKICTPVYFYGSGFVSIGKYSWVSPGTVFYTQPNGPIFIGTNCDIGHNVVFIPGSHTVGLKHRRAGDSICRPIKVGSGSWIGAQCLLFGGCTIGRSSVIGASSTVLSSLPDNYLSAGSPCKPIKPI